MAPPPPEQPSLEILTARLAASRESLGHHAASLREKLDLPARMRRTALDSVRSHPLALFGGTLGVGFIASRLFRRPKPAKAPRSGLTSVLITTAIAILKPAIIRFITDELKRRYMPGQPTPRENAETRFPLPKA